MPEELNLPHLLRSRLTMVATLSALKAGDKGTAVAKKFGISVPSLHNIKKAAGLTKARKK